MSTRGQLLWRCRRGTKELDVLLERFVRAELGRLSLAEQGTFAEILNLPDPLLTDYFFGHAAPTHPALAKLVRCIAAHRD